MGIFSLVQDLLCSKCCDRQLHVCTEPSKREGFASYVAIKCACGYSRGEYSSPIVQKEIKGMKAFGVNIRSVYTMRSCGLGYNALEMFCGLMSLPPPMIKNNYQKLSRKVRDKV